MRLANFCWLLTAVGHIDRRTKRTEATTRRSETPTLVGDDCKLPELPPDIAVQSLLRKETRADAESPYFDFQTSSSSDEIFPRMVMERWRVVGMRGGRAVI